MNPFADSTRHRRLHLTRLALICLCFALFVVAGMATAQPVSTTVAAVQLDPVTVRGNYDNAVGRGSGSSRCATSGRGR
jgi:hypothetical protein